MANTGNPILVFNDAFKLEERSLLAKGVESASINKLIGCGDGYISEGIELANAVDGGEMESAPGGYLPYCHGCQESVHEWWHPIKAPKQW